MDIITQVERTYTLTLSANEMEAMRQLSTIIIDRRPKDIFMAKCHSGEYIIQHANVIVQIAKAILRIAPTRM